MSSPVDELSVVLDSEPERVARAQIRRLPNKRRRISHHVNTGSVKNTSSVSSKYFEVKQRRSSRESRSMVTKNDAKCKALAFLLKKRPSSPKHDDSAPSSSSSSEESWISDRSSGGYQIYRSNVVPDSRSTSSFRPSTLTKVPSRDFSIHSINDVENDLSFLHEEGDADIEVPLSDLGQFRFADNVENDSFFRKRIANSSQLVDRKEKVEDIQKIDKKKGVELIVPRLYLQVLDMCPCCQTPIAHLLPSKGKRKSTLISTDTTQVWASDLPHNISPSHISAHLSECSSKMSFSKEDLVNLVHGRILELDYARSSNETLLARTIKRSKVGGNVEIETTSNSTSEHVQTLIKRGVKKGSKEEALFRKQIEDYRKGLGGGKLSKAAREIRALGKERPLRSRRSEREFGSIVQGFYETSVTHQVSTFQESTGVTQQARSRLGPGSEEIEEERPEETEYNLLSLNKNKDGEMTKRRSLWGVAGKDNGATTERIWVMDSYSLDDQQQPQNVNETFDCITEIIPPYEKNCVDQEWPGRENITSVEMRDDKDQEASIIFLRASSPNPVQPKSSSAINVDDITFGFTQLDISVHDDVNTLMEQVDRLSIQYSNTPPANVGRIDTVEKTKPSSLRVSPVIPKGMPDYESWKLDEIIDLLDGWGFKTSRNKKAMVNQLKGIWTRMNTATQQNNVSERAEKKSNKVTSDHCSDHSDTFNFSDSHTYKSRVEKLGVATSKSTPPVSVKWISEADALPTKTQTKITKGKTLAEEEAILRSAIMRDTSLYEKILRYEPVDFVLFVNIASDERLKLTRNNIKAFLDKQCVTFYTADSMKNGRTRHP